MTLEVNWTERYLKSTERVRRHRERMATRCIEEANRLLQLSKFHPEDGWFLDRFGNPTRIVGGGA